MSQVLMFPLLCGVSRCSGVTRAQESDASVSLRSQGLLSPENVLEPRFFSSVLLWEKAEFAPELVELQGLGWPRESTGNSDPSELRRSQIAEGLEELIPGLIYTGAAVL